MEITYEEAKKAKETLIKYLEETYIREYESTEDTLRNLKENIVWLALQQEYFLD
jgi:hypothetical protein